MTIINYKTSDLMPVTVGGKEVLALSADSIWFMHPNNEQLFIRDSLKHGFTAVKVGAENMTVIEWPRIEVG